MSVWDSLCRTPFSFFQYRCSREAFRFRLSEIERLAGRWDRHIQIVRGMEQFGECLGLLGLAMHQKDLAQGWRQRPDPLHQLALVGVRAQLIQARDFGPDTHGLTENPYFRPLFDELAAERILRLEPG